MPTGFDLDSTGLITYTTWGFMAANIAYTNATKLPLYLQWPPSDNETDADWAKVARSRLSYAGRFSINIDYPVSETEGQLLHGPLMVTSVPSMDGATQARNYTIIKQHGVTYLNLSFTNQLNNRADLVWKRIE